VLTSYDVFCEIRTFNNNRRTVMAAKRAINRGVGALFVSINAKNPDDRGLVRQELMDSAIVRSFRGDLIIEEDKTTWTWCNALNRGVDLAQEMGKPLFLSMSVEAEISQETFNRMIHIFNEMSDIGAVGTSFSGYKLAEETNAFVPYDLGRTYKNNLRNTCAMWRTDVFQRVGKFDPTCDATGGMEDTDLVVRMQVEAGLDFYVLHDNTLLLLPGYHDQAVKEKREIEAVLAIVDRLNAKYNEAQRRKMMGVINFLYSDKHPILG